MLWEKSVWIKEAYQSLYYIWFSQILFWHLLEWNGFNVYELPSFDHRVLNFIVVIIFVWLWSLNPGVPWNSWPMNAHEQSAYTGWFCRTRTPRTSKLFTVVSVSYQNWWITKSQKMICIGIKGLILKICFSVKCF